MAIRFEAVSPSHDLNVFRCGKPALDEWLHQHALHAETMRTARTFVGIDGDSESVVCYFALSATMVLREHESVPGRVGRGSPNQIPAIMLARLAVDARVQGHGLGRATMIEALGRIVQAGRLVAARLVVVDAIDEEAANFYEHHGFRRMPASLRLYLKTSEVEASLDD